jgi:hypothetical protein
VGALVGVSAAAAEGPAGPAAPAPGSGWERLARAVAEALPPAEIDRIWVFGALRSGTRESGTAVLSRVAGDRRRIYTARYTLAVNGKERGKFEAAVHEVGSGPVEALERLVADARRRIEDDQPPVAVEPANWFPAAAGGVPPDGPAR